MPVNVCPIVPCVFQVAGVDYRFLDISPETLCLDEATLMDAIGRGAGIAGILFVRTYGHGGDFEGVFRAIKERQPDVFLIDDRCLCRPSWEADDSVSDVQLYSSGYSKYVDIGGGGWAFSLEPVPAAPESYSGASFEAFDRDLRQALAAGQPFSAPKTPWLDLRAYPFADLRERVLQCLSAADKHRRSLRSIYERHLGAWAMPDALQVWRYNIRVKHAEALMRHIFDSGHFASRHFAPVAPVLGAGPARVAQEVAADVVNLFCDFRYSVERAEALAPLVGEYLQREYRQ